MDAGNPAKLSRAERIRFLLSASERDIEFLAERLTDSLEELMVVRSSLVSIKHSIDTIRYLVSLESHVQEKD